jgi:NTE family protein
VLSGLQEAGIPIKAIAGTSGGALIGALYAAGNYPLEAMIEIALRFRKRHFLRPAFHGGGLFSSARIGKMLSRLLGDLTFADLRIPFAAVAVDIETGETVALREGSVALAVQASCSMPILLTPTQIGDRCYVDGGIYSLVPVRAARALAPGLPVVAVDVNFQAPPIALPTRLLTIAARLGVQVARRHAMEETQEADRSIRVDVSGIRLWDFRQGRTLTERGRLAVQTQQEALRGLVRG